jgi:hypothetical protein
MSSASTDRKQYIALRASGVCVRCKVESARDGRSECGTCSTKRTASRKRNYENNRPEDLCNSCRRNKPAPGMKQCASCRILGAAAARKRAAKGKEAK